ncbi:Translation initiation factor IF-2 domain 3 superfamily [Arabidopsis thaliana x Arabidopsis arenosa]|uniref:Translation initiation factor IF-2, chloroplastic n=1 Tax=Arabidopsis thaliana x Arabidopsis arenosa TaxID=1240361 RepID=A0A8T2BX67_9BRAS|nr:Translation initiation factor IF-2 domain 3 superfamily [Arabidopsis thaliana x Arabidopsis arenosa]
MPSMLVLVGTMPSLASLVSLGGACASVSGTSSSDASYALVKRVSLSRRSVKGTKKWLCRYSVSSSTTTTTADFIAEQNNNSVSIDSNSFRGSKEGDDSEVVLKQTPKPVLKPPVARVERGLGVNTAPWSKDLSNGGKFDGEEERNKVIESLGEVLDKAEQLEIPKPGNKEGGEAVKPSQSANSSNLKNGSYASAAATRKTKTMKSVWRKGDAVAAVQKVVKESPKIVNRGMQVEPRSKEDEEVNAKAGTQLAPPQPPFRPQPPVRPQPMLQGKPMVAPPPVKKSPILKDLGMAAKPLVSEEVDSSVKSKERKPILVDKFASKKKGVDPVASQAVLAPTKPGKGPPANKFRVEHRNKKNASASPRRRIVAEDDGDEDTSISRSGRKGRKWSKASRKAVRLQAAKDAAPVKAEILEVEEEGMSIEDLAYNLAIGEGDILGYLYSKGIRPDGVQTLDREMVKMICRDYDVEVLDADSVKVEEMAKKRQTFDEEDLDKLEDRPPVITIMGHVDHGKTTLLDYIRKSKVAASEAGGITQGIGAYKVSVPVDGKLQSCVFLDTPGHEAFGAMRARGARVTDIAIIVVAADDGIRPQTNEAIAHAKAAAVPIVIAINKIDKEGASPERVMQELSSIGLMPEDWGGDVPMVQISALKGENIDDLLETVMLVAELQELKANPHRNAKGIVIEAGLDKAKGPFATFIVQKGTLKRGDVVVCGEAFGKVRALFDHSGERVDEAGPSIPVQVIGLNNVPIAGDEFEIVSSLDVAREMAEARAVSLRDERISAKAGDGKVTLSSLASAVSAKKMSGLDLHQLNIILKVDVQGSIEAVRQALQVLPQENVTLKFLLQATGDVSNSDVDLASASEAIIFGFNVKASGSVKKAAENKGVEIRLYRVIYELIDDVRNAMEGLLESVEEQIPIGSAEVRATFSSGSGRVAGCMVNEGKFVKDCGIRVVRKGKTVHVGVLDSLKRVKENVKEVSAGLECGIGMDDYDDWIEGDIIEAFNAVQKRRTLEEASASMSAAIEEAGV